MGRTPIKKGQAEFSKKCHHIARKELYPVLFNSPSQGLEYDYKFGDADDLEKGIDATVSARLIQDRLPLTFTIQERFRKYDKGKIERFNDVTFTTWNRRSNTPSEWYKFSADFMVYGFANTKETRLFNWSVVAIPVLQLRYIARQILPVTSRINDRGQDFMAFRNQDLYRLGCLVGYKNIKIDNRKGAFNSHPRGVEILNEISSQLHEILNMGFSAHKAAALQQLRGHEAGVITNKIYDILNVIDNYHPK